MRPRVKTKIVKKNRPDYKMNWFRTRQWRWRWRCLRSRLNINQSINLSIYLSINQSINLSKANDDMILLLLGMILFLYRHVSSCPADLNVILVTVEAFREDVRCAWEISRTRVIHVAAPPTDLTFIYYMYYYCMFLIVNTWCVMIKRRWWWWWRRWWWWWW